jgi:hypothetical protein
VSSTPELPELPGSLLLENQGFPLAITPVTARPTSQVTRRETHPPDQLFEDERYRLNPLGLAPAPLVHTKSVPDLSFRSSTMRSSRGGNALKPIHSSAQHKKSLSETNARRSSRPNIITSPSSAGSNPTRSSDSTIKHNDNNNTGWRSLEPALPISERRTYDIDSESHPSYRNQVSIVRFFTFPPCITKIFAQRNHFGSSLVRFHKTVRQCRPDLGLQNCLR